MLNYLLNISHANSREGFWVAIFYFITHPFEIQNFSSTDYIWLNIAYIIAFLMFEAGTLYAKIYEHYIKPEPTDDPNSNKSKFLKKYPFFKKNWISRWLLLGLNGAVSKIVILIHWVNIILTLNVLLMPILQIVFPNDIILITYRFSMMSGYLLLIIKNIFTWKLKLI